jgi:exosortase E/protease (VPEID-CTERM system)
VGILAIELIGITYWFQAPILRDDPRWSAYLFSHSREIWRIGLWMSGSCLLLLRPRLKPVLRTLCEQPSEYRWPVWLVWLVLQLLVFAAFSAITAFIFETPTDPARLSSSWLAGWLALAGTTVMLWLLALAPGRIWWRWAGQARLKLLLGGLLGVGAWVLIRPQGLLAQAAPWNTLAEPTLHLVYWLLGWIYPNLIYQPENFVVGTGSFPVFIHYTCSGSEGIFLITLFLSIYCWLFRQDLRFPQAFWLFPLGIIAVWFANAVRITLLIVVGTSFSQEIALQGFHAQAGWIVFTLIAVGTIALSHQLQFFTIAKPDSRGVRTCPPLAAALLVPLGVLMTTAMVTSAASSGFDWLYPLRVVATATALYAFRRAYRGLGWTWTWSAPLIGTVVFLLWMFLEPTPDHRTTALSDGLAELSHEAAAVWLIFRILGAVITVPLAEELAFRGYLLRKLIAKDFNQVPLGQFSWRSFLLTSVLFGLLHGRWLAGTLAGTGYALAQYRRGQVGDAVVAHMTTNALIALVVLTQARWSLWS